MNHNHFIITMEIVIQFAHHFLDGKTKPIVCYKMFTYKRYEIWYKLIRPLKRIAVYPSNGVEIEFNLEGCFSICNEDQIYNDMHTLQSTTIYDWIDIFAALEENAEFAIRISNPTDDRMSFNDFLDLVELLDESITQFTENYWNCQKYMRYINECNYSGTYLELVPKPIFEIVKSLEYNHLMMKRISAFADSFKHKHLRAYFSGDYDNFEVITYDGNLFKMIKEFSNGWHEIALFKNELKLYYN